MLSVLVFLFMPHCPIDGGEIGSRYGFRDDPFTTQRRFHTGVDIPYPSGLPIRSMWEGRVVRAHKGAGAYGNFVVIESGGLRTKYAHCDELLAEVGEWVGAGEIIATVGATGRATGPHLHLEIHRGKKRVNPTGFVEGCRAGEPIPIFHVVP